jgi:hypothetical protein
MVLLNCYYTKKYRQIWIIEFTSIKNKFFVWI